MNARTLIIATLIALGLSSGMLYLGSNLKIGSAPTDEEAQHEFRRTAIDKLNLSRASLALDDLQLDEELQKWLDGRLIIVTGEHSTVDPKTLLDELPDSVSTLSSAAVRTVVAKGTEGIMKQLDFWSDGFDPDASLVAMRLFEADRGRVGCVLIAADRAPQFSISLLNDGVTEFYNVCRHCNEPHLGNLAKVDLALAVGCPHCGRTYDLLAADMLGRYRRANAYLEGSRPPPGVGADAEDRLGEMVALWTAVVEHCRYAKDLSGLSGEKDSWQRPSETYSFRNGDCEDTALLLADWLISRGFNARVAIGNAVGEGGHAWCVVELEGRQYILETTLAKTSKVPPETQLVASRYRPHYLFDRQSLYFLDGQLGDIADYFSPDLWDALAYQNSPVPDDGLGDDTAIPLAGSTVEP